MKVLFRWAWRSIVLLVLLTVLASVAAVLFRDALIRRIAAYQIESRTGLRTTIGSVHIGLRAPVLSIKNLVIYNTANFGGKPLLDLPELSLAYDWNDFEANKIHATALRFNLSQLNIVDDAKGRNNVQEMEKNLQKNGPLFTFKKSPQRRHKHQAMEFAGIDKLDLTLGRATYTQMKPPPKQVELRMQVNHQQFTAIKSEDDLSGVLLVALLRSGANIMPSSGSGLNWLQWLNPGSTNSP